jgi:hypothetical protein
VLSDLLSQKYKEKHDGKGFNALYTPGLRFLLKPDVT